MTGSIYILKSQKTHKYYIGSTKNIEKRLYEHNSGQTKSTKNGIPWQLVFSQVFDSVQLARKIEYKLKKLKNRKILEKIITEGIVKLR